MDAQRLENRIASMRHCMETAKYLDDNPRHSVSVPASASEVEIEDAKDKARLSRKYISHMLNAIVLEIAVKVIWEIDNERKCRYTHNIIALYRQLSERSQEELRAIYEEKSAEIAGLEGTGKNGERITISDLVELQSLEDALMANEDTMKNFKYDGVFSEKSSTMGSMIWDGNLLWTFPPLKRIRLPEALYSYTKDRVEEVQRGDCLV